MESEGDDEVCGVFVHLAVIFIHGLSLFCFPPSLIVCLSVFLSSHGPCESGARGDDDAVSSVLLVPAHRPLP